MNGVEDLKTKVINTLNILSGQDITETKLYKTILTADEKQKKALIGLSFTFATTFVDFGRLLETTEIYKWLEIIFDRFEKEGIFIKDTMDIVKKVDIVFENLSSEKELAKNDEIRFVAHDYAKIWTTYFCYHEFKFEKFMKIIQPLELFIITAITIIPIACHFDQKQPFENFVNIDFNSVIRLLIFEYIPTNESIFEKFSKIDKKCLNENQDLQYTILDLLINKNSYKEGCVDPQLSAIKGYAIDSMFKSIINVSEKSEYEKLRALYKK